MHTQKEKHLFAEKRLAFQLSTGPEANLPGPGTRMALDSLMQTVGPAIAIAGVVGVIGLGIYTILNGPPKGISQAIGLG